MGECKKPAFRGFFCVDHYKGVSNPFKRARDCSVAECYRPVFRGDLCGAHHKRQQRNERFNLNKPVVGLVLEKLDPEERVIKTGSEWLECSAEDDALYSTKRATWLRAVHAWMLALGWVPPPRGLTPKQMKIRVQFINDNLRRRA